jgi:hypothetical protein
MSHCFEELFRLIEIGDLSYIFYAKPLSAQMPSRLSCRPLTFYHDSITIRSNRRFGKNSRVALEWRNSGGLAYIRRSFIR